MLSEIDDWTAGIGGTLLHWDGNTWQNVESPTTNNQGGLSALNPDDVWTTAGTGFLHWDGSQWLKLPASFSGLENLSMVSSRDAQ